MQFVQVLYLMIKISALMGHLRDLHALRTGVLNTRAPRSKNSEVNITSILKEKVVVI